MNIASATAPSLMKQGSCARLAPREALSRELTRQPGLHARAARLFATKWPNVLKVVAFRARRGGLREVTDDIAQWAGLHLWQQCLRASDPSEPPFRIDCAVIARAGFMKWKQDADRHREVFSLANLDGPGDDDNRARGIPDRPRTIRQDGVELNVSDAKLDHPAACDYHFGKLLTTRGVMARLGVSRQYVHSIKDRLAGVRVGSRWGFPPDVVAHHAEHRRSATGRGATR